LNFGSADALNYLTDTATGVLIGDYECASEVSGIQFNDQLKQVATSHHSCLPEAAGSHVGTFSSNQIQKNTLIYIFFLLLADSWCRKHRSALATYF